MRIEIKCSAPFLPEDYRRIGLSILKRLVSTTNRNFYETLFVGEKKFRKKPYTYCIVFKGEKLNNLWHLRKDSFKVVLATSSPLFASAVISAIPIVKDIEVFIANQGKMPISLKGFRILKEVFSPNVFVRSFVLPEDWIEKKYPELLKGLSLPERIKKYFSDNNYTFRSYRIRRKKTVYGIRGYRNNKFTCFDLKLYGVNGDLEKLYQEGIGHFKSQGFGFPMPIIS